MALRVTTLAAKVEGIEEDGAENGGAARAAGSVVSTCGHFD